MAEIKYGHMEGPGRGKEIPVAASQYFSRLGGHFVYLNAGNVTLNASATGIVAGWAEVPKDTAGYNAWKSSATAETDKVFVITGLGDTFKLPIDETNASLAASYLGQGACLMISGSTYTTIQSAKIGGNVAASPVSIVGVDVANKTVLVKIKPSKLQAAG